MIETTNITQTLHSQEITHIIQSLTNLPNFDLPNIQDFSELSSIQFPELSDEEVISVSQQNSNELISQTTNWFSTIGSHMTPIWKNLQVIYNKMASIDPDIVPKTVLTIKEKGIETTIAFAERYWKTMKYYGFGLQFIDDIILSCLILRLFFFWIRYNLVTSFAINIISTIAAYLWYCTFLNAINIYEDLLYQNTWTFRLGVDATQIRVIMQGQVAKGDYGLRITNPLGILLMAIGYGSSYEGHRIDPLSLFMARVPDKIPFYNYIEGTYYYIYYEFFPLAVRTFTGLVEQFRSYMIYAYMTRVNRRFCPYVIRWHWTFIMLMKFVEPFFIHVLFRLIDYQEKVVLPQIELAKRFNMILPGRVFELELIYGMGNAIIIAHLAFILYGMFHALWGQYFYVPFITENVELHVGLRDKSSIYSGGHTAWQDPKEKPKGFIPKFWYGWFGRGTKTTPLIILILRRLTFDPIYTIIRIILSIIRRIFRRR